MIKTKKNLLIYLIVFIILVVVSLIIGLAIYFAKKNEKNEKNENSEVENKIVYPDNNNKVILLDGKFIRYDPGLYDRPTSYPGVIHHGPQFVDLNS
jgi:flagellar basal body-associated protein FliL